MAAPAKEDSNASLLRKRVRKLVKKLVSKKKKKAKR